MKRWAPKELLCNSRGLDDGYVFLHKDHPLSKETMFILNTKDEYTKDKFRLSGKDIARVSCFFGFFRKPLSHEMHSTDDDSISCFGDNFFMESGERSSFSLPEVEETGE